jgi:protein SCO1/2
VHNRNKEMNLINRRLAITILLFFVTYLTTTPLVAKELISNATQENVTPDSTVMMTNYETPNVEVIRKDEKQLAFIKELDDGRPVIMNFIFASCSAICPMLSHVFMQVQDGLEKDKQKVHLVSISIDPENDTPANLNEYAKKFKAGDQWDFYTGKLDTSIAIQKAFNVYRGDKMNHASIILMRVAPGKPWLRLEGFISSDAVIREYLDMNQK